MEILKTLYREAEVIILDEPTVGLDPRQIIEIRELIRELGKKHTVILSSHILSEVQAVCQTIMIISKGKLVACDTPENLERVFANSTDVELVAEGTEAEIRQILETVGQIASMQITEQENGCCACRLTAEQSEESLRRELFFAFSRAQRPILRMTAEKPSLEDIFIKLTNKPTAETLRGRKEEDKK